MNGSGTIRVLKRDRSVELFHVGKLAGAMWRAADGARAKFEDIRRIAEAVEMYLIRRGTRCVSSQAVFEMALKALRHVGLAPAAEAAERYRQWRMLLRGQLRVRHEEGKLTYWDKGWLRDFACRSWRIMPTTARILAGIVELRLLRGDDTIVRRQAVVDMLNDVMAEYGLADAVPVIPRN